MVSICVTLTVTALGDYSIDWYTIDGGGGTSTGGPYVLSGTVGQADAGRSSGGDYVLGGGFWPGSGGCVVNLVDLAIFLDQWLLAEPELAADFDGSGTVDINDFAELSYFWFDYCPGDWPLK